MTSHSSSKTWARSPCLFSLPRPITLSFVIRPLSPKETNKEHAPGHGIIGIILRCPPTPCPSVNVKCELWSKWREQSIPSRVITRQYLYPAFPQRRNKNPRTLKQGSVAGWAGTGEARADPVPSDHSPGCLQPEYMRIARSRRRGSRWTNCGKPLGFIEEGRGLVKHRT